MISIPNTNLRFKDEPRIILKNGLKFNPDGSIKKGQNCQINQGDTRLVEYPNLPGAPVEYWVLTAYGWEIHDQVLSMTTKTLRDCAACAALKICDAHNTAGTWPHRAGGKPCTVDIDEKGERKCSA